MKCWGCRYLVLNLNCLTQKRKDLWYDRKCSTAWIDKKFFPAMLAGEGQKVLPYVKEILGTDSCIRGNKP